MAAVSREWIEYLHVRFSEIVSIFGDDDEIVNERGRCDQAVLYWHRFTGLAQVSEKSCPSQARERIPWNAYDSCDALIKPKFESPTSRSYGQEMNAEANLAQDDGVYRYQTTVLLERPCLFL